MRKTIFLCKSKEDTAICPECNHQLQYRDTKIRCFKVHGGSQSKIIIRRLKCSHCSRFHNELPDFLSPHKHYTVEVIEDVVDDVVDSDTLATEDYPSRRTMKRWKRWIKKNVAQIDGYLKSINHLILGFSESHLKSSSSLLMTLREASSGWLGIINRKIYNSGGFLPP